MGFTFSTAMPLALFNFTILKPQGREILCDKPRMSGLPTPASSSRSTASQQATFLPFIAGNTCNPLLPFIISYKLVYFIDLNKY